MYLKRFMKWLWVAAMVSLSLPTVAQHNSAITEDEAYEIGLDAYDYFYPLVSMDITRRVSTNTPIGTVTGSNPLNMFSHIRAYPDSDFRTVVRPNFDTLYSLAWLDLTKGPVIVSVPDTEGRYYLLPMLDMWTDVFAAPGKRTSGTHAAHFALVPRGWQGTLPQGVERIDAPTPYVWIIGRTQTNGPKDYTSVHKIQDGYKITPLMYWGKHFTTPTIVVDPSVDMKSPPLNQVNNMTAERYFPYAAELMKVNPPHISDWSILEKMKRVGIEPGKSLDWDNLPLAVQSGLKRAVIDALAELKKGANEEGRLVNGWLMNTSDIGVYGNNYRKRAIISLIGLGANVPEDAIYPLAVSDSNGQPLQGERKYVLHFEKSQLPPVSAFWSVTMYDQDGFQTANTLNRFALGDRDQLQYNKDGSLDIYIQHKSPGKNKESNWLPAPASGQLGITMRLYGPEHPVISESWDPPAIRPVK